MEKVASRSSQVTDRAVAGGGVLERAEVDGLADRGDRPPHRTLTAGSGQASRARHGALVLFVTAAVLVRAGLCRHTDRRMEVMARRLSITSEGGVPRSRRRISRLIWTLSGSLSGSGGMYCSCTLGLSFLEIRAANFAGGVDYASTYATVNLSPEYHRTVWQNVFLIRFDRLGLCVRELSRLSERKPRKRTPHRTVLPCW